MSYGYSLTAGYSQVCSSQLMIACTIRWFQANRKPIDSLDNLHYTYMQAYSMTSYSKDILYIISTQLQNPIQTTYIKILVQSLFLLLNGICLFFGLIWLGTLLHGCLYGLQYSIGSYMSPLNLCYGAGLLRKYLVQSSCFTLELTFHIVGILKWIHFLLGPMIIHTGSQWLHVFTSVITLNITSFLTCHGGIYQR